MNIYERILDGVDNAFCECRMTQEKLVRQILEENGNVGNLLGHVNGENGSYEVESVYIDTDTARPMVHADFPSFDADIEFDFMSVCEQNQIIKLMIHELDYTAS